MYKIDFKEYFIYLNDVHKYGKKQFKKWLQLTVLFHLGKQSQL